MPFESRFARSFTAVTIEREAPAESGVFGISNSERWLLIEESENIRASLVGQLANFTGQPNDLPSGFSFELSPSYNRTARRDRLIAELMPFRKPGASPGRRRARG